ncbi:tRNA U-34 5-methylaminomethyl-2-thiouridine biosynthesis protein MnmC [Anopheles sinensis]|uniref:tRNA U-34 5-methylaminomethyl-2-thiouridine biosynthesis protein MnmC n=1 Tax=Anopheles sinensis TaxID=74873 RepID=A0A084WL62_ANOSI|nr:tRNA U-34 5-methylaminomethyl-2-thiouridine biosynthesis protein MnmC [Anopheles sinensis]
MERANPMEALNWTFAHPSATAEQQHRRTRSRGESINPKQVLTGRGFVVRLVSATGDSWVSSCKSFRVGWRLVPDRLPMMGNLQSSTTGRKRVRQKNNRSAQSSVRSGLERARERVGCSGVPYGAMHRNNRTQPAGSLLQKFVTSSA